MEALSNTLYWLAVQQSAWYASAFGLAGTLAMGYRCWWGPLLGVLAEMFYVVLGIWTGQPGLWLDAGVWAAVYAGVSWKWWRDRSSLPSARVAVRRGRARGQPQAVRVGRPVRMQQAPHHTQGQRAERRGGGPTGMRPAPKMHRRLAKIHAKSIPTQER